MCVMEPSWPFVTWVASGSSMRNDSPKSATLACACVGALMVGIKHVLMW